MIELNGKYNSARVFTDVIEQDAVTQIIAFCSQPVSEGARIRIMPDVHAGAGCTIGTTMTITDKVKWSSDDKDEEYFTITVDKDDGNKVTVECLKYSETPLKLYAEIFGKKVECVIRFRKA